MRFKILFEVATFLTCLMSGVATSAEPNEGHPFDLSGNIELQFPANRPAHLDDAYELLRRIENSNRRVVKIVPYLLPKTTTGNVILLSGVSLILIPTVVGVCMVTASASQFIFSHTGIPSSVAQAGFMAGAMIVPAGFLSLYVVPSVARHINWVKVKHAVINRYKTVQTLAELEAVRMDLMSGKVGIGANENDLEGEFQALVEVEEYKRRIAFESAESSNRSCTDLVARL